MSRIYLDNASTTPVLPIVADQMYTILQEHYGNPSSIHAHGRKTRAIIEEARKKVARIIYASVGEVFFTSSATEANNLVLKNIVSDRGIRRIISCRTEHHCVLHSLEYVARTTNCVVEYLDVDDKGRLDYAVLEQSLSTCTGPVLVSLMFGNNEIGTLHDAELIGQICHKHKALFHCDAVQALGKLPVDVQKLGAHYLSGSAHKFHGPKGSGIAFISGDAMLSPLLHGGAQERNMRAGTENVAGIAGLATALEWCAEHREEHQRLIHSLKQQFRGLLQEGIPQVAFNGADGPESLAHILSVAFPPHPGDELLVMNLDIAGISVSSGSACSSGIEEDSHVLTAIGHDSARKTIRFSFSALNTASEVEEAARKVIQLIKS